ncbi:MAG: hypothetical protein AB8H79_11705 [Myxococcota bacterium]
MQYSKQSSTASGAPVAKAPVAATTTSPSNADQQAAMPEVGAESGGVLEAVEAEHSFDAGGETHRLWFEGNEPMVASTPSRLQDFVNNLSDGQRQTIESAQGYDRQLDVILEHAARLRNLATEARKAVVKPVGDAFDETIAPLTEGQQEVMRALKFVFDVLPQADKRDLVLDLFRARQDDITIRLETALAAAGNAQDQQPMVEWIESLGVQLGEVRQLLVDNVDRDAVVLATEELDRIEPQVTIIEESLVDAIAGQAAIDTALQEAESPEWRERLETILGILSRARARVTAAIPFGRVRFRGSLATGWKGPHKVEQGSGAARRFNPEEFDADAFVELPNEVWLKMVDDELVDEGDLYAKSSELVGWEHQGLLVQLEADIGQELADVAGYQREESGEIHFDFTVQPTSSSWKNLRDGLASPQNAFGLAGEDDLQATLPDNPNTPANKRTRFPGIFQGE